MSFCDRGLCFTLFAHPSVSRKAGGRTTSQQRMRLNQHETILPPMHHLEADPGTVTPFCPKTSCLPVLGEATARSPYHFIYPWSRGFTGCLIVRGVDAFGEILPLAVLKFQPIQNCTFTTSFDSSVRSWAPKILMRQAIGGLGGLLSYDTNRSCRSIHSFHYTTRQRLGTFSFFLHFFLSLPSRESGYRCSVFAGTKAWHIRIYDAQLCTVYHLPGYIR